MHSLKQTTMKKLPKTFKKKWIAALRSGDYQQGAGYLYDGMTNTYCCLGVAVAMSGCSLMALDQQGTIDPNRIDFVPSLITGTVEENPIVKNLTHFNDGYIRDSEAEAPPKSFNWIASYIERYL